MKSLIIRIQKEVRNLCTFLTKTLPNDNGSNNEKYLMITRTATYDMYENILKEVMTRKAEKVNSIRRNSLAFIDKQVLVF